MKVGDGNSAGNACNLGLGRRGKFAGVLGVVVMNEELFGGELKALMASKEISSEWKFLGTQKLRSIFIKIKGKLMNFPFKFSPNFTRTFMQQTSGFKSRKLKFLIAFSTSAIFLGIPSQKLSHYSKLLQTSLNVNYVYFLSPFSPSTALKLSEFSH
jgi:hypothetical protein